jgi:hypothetical protein
VCLIGCLNLDGRTLTRTWMGGLQPERLKDVLLMFGAWVKLDRVASYPILYEDAGRIHACVYVFFLHSEGGLSFPVCTTPGKKVSFYF